MAEPMEINRYLDRIAYRESRSPSPANLRSLHRAHLYAVPFENLSIHTGERISLKTDWLYRKIVERGRGGFCYELNGLFAGLLEALGYRVGRLSAGVWSSQKGKFGPEFDHLALRVDLDEPWLVDVGFGDSFLEPLRLTERGEQVQPEGRFRITQEGAGLICWRFEDEAWQPQYRFTERVHELADFNERCVFHQTSPESSFTRRWLATLPHPGGRETLTQEEDAYRLISTHKNKRRERIIYGHENAALLLEELFGIYDLGSAGKRAQRKDRR